MFQTTVLAMGDPQVRRINKLVVGFYEGKLGWEMFIFQRCLQLDPLLKTFSLVGKQIQVADISEVVKGQLTRIVTPFCEEKVQMNPMTWTFGSFWWLSGSSTLFHIGNYTGGTIGVFTWL